MGSMHAGRFIPSSGETVFTKFTTVTFCFWTHAIVHGSCAPCCTQREYEQMVGVWTDMDRSALCVFSWRPDCIQGTRLAFDSMTMSPLRAPFQRLASDGVTAVRLMNEKHCWLKEYKVNGGHLVRSPSAVAEAAASVAVGGVGSTGITESP